MRTAMLRYCPFVSLAILAFAIPTSAALTYSVKTLEADMFRTEALEPPPVAALAKGEILKMIHRGAANSLLETESGIKGWMRNSDLLAMKAAGDRNVRLKEQGVTGGLEAISPWVPGKRFGMEADLLPERDFDGEIVEPRDREQVEMRHDEN